MKLMFMALAFAGLALMPAAAPAQGKAAVQRDWSRTVLATPEGGYRMGNPNAPVKLVEYGSLTCPHCAEFSREGVQPLIAEFVKKGKVSFEFRNFVLNGVDGIAALLARCAGPQGFFPLTEGIYANQPQWLGKIQAISQEEGAKLNQLPQADQFLQVAELSGLLALAARAGVTRQEARQCFADKTGQEQLQQIATTAAKLGIRGTPSFLINGSKVDAAHWSEVEPLLRRAGG